MKFKHTPKPWLISPRITNGTKGYEIQFGKDGENITDHVYEAADALLIAAAPEMLEALKRCVDVLSDTDNEKGSKYYKAVEQAEATIAKAEEKK